MVNNGVAFAQLADLHNGATAGISKKKLKERVKSAMVTRRDSVDDAELDHMVSFVFDSLAAEDTSKISFGRNLMNMCREVVGIRTASVNTAKMVNIDQFNVAYSRHEPICWDHLVSLFDRDRHAS